MNELNIKYLDRVSSTNEYLKQILEKERPAGQSMVFAEEQTAGKGQRGNSWHSLAGKNSLGSIVLYPDFLPPMHQFKISKVIALAISSLLSAYLDPGKLSIKWPNDILYGTQKIAGILIETSLLGSRFDYIIGGIGINVNQSQFPAHLPNAVSIHNVTGSFVDLKKFNKQLLSAISHYYQKDYLLSEQVNSDYLHNLFRFDQWAYYRDRSGEFRARIRDVNEYGHLQLMDSNQNIREYAFKEIVYL